MAFGAIWSPPYGAIAGLVAWIRQPGRWHELDGECASRGVDIRALRFDQFLNVVYYSIRSRIQPERNRDPRKELDNMLNVRSWVVPGEPMRHVVRIPGAPAWWTDDEDASQEFMQSMGVTLRG